MAQRCDRCGDKLPLTPRGHIDINETARIDLYQPGQYRYQSSAYSERIDLCESCYEKFVNWLESEAEGE